jgi:hypothetical protein
MCPGWGRRSHVGRVVCALVAAIVQPFDVFGSFSEHGAGN